MAREERRGSRVWSWRVVVLHNDRNGFDDGELGD